MDNNKLVPDYIFESSWEVCNKVGGIYTVLSTRANTLQSMMKDHVIFIGPDCWGVKPCPYFEEDKTLFVEWKKSLANTCLKLKIGRWTIPGSPIAILVDFNPFYSQKDDIFSRLWDLYRVDSLHAYGDYDEASMFSYAAGLVVESFYNFYLDITKKVVYHGNEWMTGLGLLYINHKIPAIATIFTTHATSIGRSIAGNNKPLYDYLFAYNGDQMAQELNMQSKHSIEKQTALNVDCFTTVSEITAKECAELMDKPVDFVLPNGFENDFVPRGAAFTKKRKEARKKLLEVASCLTGSTIGDDALIIATSGRYEFRNKGIDVFIEAMNRLRFDNRLNKNIVAFIEVPAWVGNPRQDLLDRFANGNGDTPLEYPMLTHWLNNMNEDKVLGMMNYLEPWGYTPLEAVAFKVPCITTDLAGFGLWANSVKGSNCNIEDGVEVIHRTDYNYSEVADAIKDTVVKFASFDDAQVKRSRLNAEKLSKKALWSKFIAYYEDAYDFALRKAELRK